MVLEAARQSGCFKGRQNRKRDYEEQGDWEKRGSEKWVKGEGKKKGEKARPTNVERLVRAR